MPINGTIPANTTPDVSVGYGYDSFGRLQTVTDNSIAAPNITIYYYDLVGNLDHFTLGQQNLWGDSGSGSFPNV
jgi:hypothetical protein